MTNASGNANSNAGTIASLDNKAGGVLTNTGSITGGATNAGTFNTSGTVGGNLTNTAGTTTNTGTISGTAAVSGGTLDNQVGGKVLGTTTITGLGTVNNSGALAAVDNLNRFATFNNKVGGTAGDVRNFGTGTNAGTIGTLVENLDVFTNTGKITGDANTAAFLSNSGEIVGKTTLSAAPSLLLNTGKVGVVDIQQGSFTNKAAGTAGAVTNAGTSSNAGTIASLANTAGSFLNTGTISGAADVTGGKLTTTGTIGGGLTNSAAVEAAGKISGPIANKGAGLLTVTGDLVADNTLTNKDTANLAVAGGNLTGITTLTNTSVITVADGKTLSAGTINNNAGSIGLGIGAKLEGKANTLNNAALISVATNGAIVDAGAVNNLATGVIDFNGPGGTATLSSGIATIDNQGAINLLSGGLKVTGNVTNAKTIAVADGAGPLAVTGNVTNGVGGTIAIGNGGVVAVTGSTTNGGIIGFTGAGSYGTGGNLANTGSILMQQGGTNVANAGNNTVTVGGNYAGGGKLSIDVNTSTGASDTLNVAGTTAGVTAININAVQQGLAKTTVVTTGGTSNGAFVFGGGNGLDPIAAGLVQYALVRDPANQSNWVILPNVNNQSLAGLVQLASSVSTITTAFHQPASNFVNSKPNPAANESQWGIWARGDAARFTVNTTTTGGDPTGNLAAVNVDATHRIRYEAIQSGVDYAVLNINGSKWNAHVGVTGGTVTGSVRSDQVRTELDTPFASIYGFITNGSFTFDLTARKEWHDVDFSSAVIGGDNRRRVDGGAEAVAAVATYRFASGTGWFVTPAAGISYTRTHLDPFIAGNGLAQVVAGSDEALIGRLALQVSYAVPVTQSFVLQPFVSAAASRNFTNTTDATVLLTDPVGGGVRIFDTETVGVRDSMQYSAGIAAAETKLGVTTFIQGSVREGDRIQGGSVTVGGRINF